MSYILEVFVFCGHGKGFVEIFVVAGSRNVSEHFFVPVCKRWRVVSLLELSFHFAPLHIADGNVVVVGARTRTGFLGDNPGRGGFRIRLVDFCC